MLYLDYFIFSLIQREIKIEIVPYTGPKPIHTTVRMRDFFRKNQVAKDERELNSLSSLSKKKISFGFPKVHLLK